MKTLNIVASVVLTLCTLVSQSVSATTTPLNAQSLQNTASSEPAVETQAKSAMASAPLLFVENVGQFGSGARFQARGGGGGALWLAEDALWLSLHERPSQQFSKQSTELAKPRGLDKRGSPDEQSAQDKPKRGVNLKLSFVGANPHPQIEPLDRQATHVSYLLGSDPSKWHSDVPVWGGVHYKDLYPGIDLEVRGTGGAWSWQVVAQEGADLSAVRLKVLGADGLSLVGVSQPHLQAKTAVGEVALPLLAVSAKVAQAPGAVQVDGDEISSPFATGQGSGVGAETADTASTSSLIYSTFLGGGGSDASQGISVDALGNAYVTGTTYSSDFPTTPGAFDTSFSGDGYSDAFVTKLNASGTALVYSTYLGGSSYEFGASIAVDSSGNSYLTGSTSSTDFPTTSGAFDTSFGNNDAFVTKLNPTGTALVYSTFLGGSGGEGGSGIAVDGSGYAYVTGSTSSSDLPTTADAFDTSFNGASGEGGDVFVIKLNPTGMALVYSTFLGGSDGDGSTSIALDASGNAYVAGGTYSSDFPTTPGAFDTSFDGGDAFLTKLNAAGTALDYSTFLGGSDSDVGQGIAVDSSGNAYVTGYTYSADFPTSPGAFDTSFTSNGYSDAFVTKLNPTGTALVYSTFLAGRMLNFGRAIAVDSSGRAYVTGETWSYDFPTTPDAFDTSHNGGFEDFYADVYLTKLNTTGTALVYSTFFGGSGGDVGRGIAVDSSGNAYVSGEASSSDFPTTPGAFDTGFSGGDAFVLAISLPNVTYDAQVNLLSQPVRLVDTRSGSGHQGAGVPLNGYASHRRFTLAGYGGIPTTATAVLVNLTAVGYRADGWLSAYAACTTRPATSNVNFDTQENAIANFAIVKLGTGSGCQGAIDVTGASGTHVIVDAVGYTVAGSYEQMIHFLSTPQRVVDTRSGSGYLGAGQRLQGISSPRCYQIAGKAGVPGDAHTVVINLTAVGYTRNGWIAAYPYDPTKLGQVPSTSSVNYDTDENSIANFAIVRLGQDGKLCLTGSSATNAIIDVSGYMVPGMSGQIAILSGPVRVVDTRSDSGYQGAGQPLQGVADPHSYQLAGQGVVGDNATAVIVNVTAVGYTRDGWVAAYPSGGSFGGTSSVNYDPDENAIANFAIAKLGPDGKLVLLGSTRTNAIIDVSGYLR